MSSNPGKRRPHQLQIREYIERYHPDLGHGDLAIDIRQLPSGGAIATVRKTRGRQRHNRKP
jgi:oxalate decarboxylase/phosphoglucose isomerase-like protein (cupin superfamily)